MEINFSTLRMVVSNVEAAKDWFHSFTGLAPIEDSPNFVAFQLGTSTLEILLADEKNPASFGGSIGYWMVKDLDKAIAKAESLGAEVYRGPLYVSEINKTICQISTPFGANIGLEAKNDPFK